jgi:hypothetical protein
VRPFNARNPSRPMMGNISKPRVDSPATIPAEHSAPTHPGSGQKRAATGPRFLARGRWSASKTSARLRTMTLPAPAFAHRNLSAEPCRRWKSDTFDTL